jgi:hypothetical protein
VRDGKTGMGRRKGRRGGMTMGMFIAVYAVVATAIGLAYFARQQWHDFFDRHAIRGEAREALTLHLLIGAAAVGAAWPVAVVFALYGVYMTHARRVAGRPPAPAEKRAEI